jgi:HAD domain in Swiss Army Knife RNA repair proteins
MQPKERVGRSTERSRPLLMVDIDGVISLFANELPADADGSFHSIEGIPHFLSATAAAHLLDLGAHFELVWASGWEERADDHLPHLLGLPKGLPFLSFERGAVAPRRALQGAGAGSVAAHWKLDAIEQYAAGRPLAWIDDALDAGCHDWAAAREAPTLLVQTEPSVGLTGGEAALLSRWASSLQRG